MDNSGCILADFMGLGKSTSNFQTHSKKRYSNHCKFFNMFNFKGDHFTL
jgi:hypothetical protein